MFKRSSFFIVVMAVVMIAAMSPFAANAALFGGDGNSGAADSFEKIVYTDVPVDSYAAGVDDVNFISNMFMMNVI